MRCYRVATERLSAALLVSTVSTTAIGLLSAPVESAPSCPITRRVGFAVGNNLVWLDDRALAGQLDGMAAIGVRWIRHDLQWNSVQPESSTSYEWGAYDRLVREAGKRGMGILLVLAYTPRWARTPSAVESMFAAPVKNGQFARFAGHAAQRYARMGVHAWEIWNEPNITQFWKPAPSVKAYADLLRRSYVAIKQADPSATVVSGGLSPAVTSSGNIAPRDFVVGLYAHGVKGSFDILGHHPYTFPALPSRYYEWSAWSQMSDTHPSLRGIMASHGDRKPIWATELGVPTSGMAAVSESLQARSIEAAADELQDKPWLGKLFLYSYTDIGTSTTTIENFFGVVRHDGTYKPGYYSVRRILSDCGL